jgi:hypothetical protein
MFARLAAAGQYATDSLAAATLIANRKNSLHGDGRHP